jgi:hypothetical protein
MAKKNDHLSDFATENTGGVLSGFLADEEHLDRRAMFRLGTWGVASVGAIVVALLANQSSLRLRHDELAAADLTRQAQQIQSLARESQNETRYLASAINTLNTDRDRMYTRLSTLEQGLDSVTGAIAKQNTAQNTAATPPATPAPVASTIPSAPATAAASAAPTPSVSPPAAEGVTPAPVPEAAATEPTPLIGPVATTTAVIKQSPEAKRREQANAKMAAAAPTPIPAPSPAAPAALNSPATTAAMPPPPMGPPKSMMGPPDPAAPKLIELEPAKVAAVTSPAPQTAPAPAAPTAQATQAAPESAAAAPPADKPAAEKTAAVEPVAQGSPQLAVNRTEFGVDVGGANSVGGLRALWRGLLKTRSNAPLAALQPIIVIKEGNNGLGMQLRLVAGPLTDAAAAAKICATMSENERPCTTTVYDGQHLALKADDTPATTGTISPKTEPEADKPAADRPVPPKSVSGRQNWRHHGYQRHTAVEEPPAEKPKPTSGPVSTISSFFHRSN